MNENEVDWSIQYKLVNRGVLLGLEQYYDRLKRLHKSKEAEDLREYIDELREEIWR